MARYWVGQAVADNDPTDTANWSATSGGEGGASVPGSSDDVIFDGVGDNANQACTSVGDLNWNSLTMTSGYTAKFDLDDDTLTITENGNVTLGGGGIFDAGSGTIYMTNGDFSNVNVTTYTYDSSTLSMGGIGTITSSSSKDICHLTVRSGATITQTTRLDLRGTLTLDGIFSINVSCEYYGLGTAKIVLNDGGQLTGSGDMYLYCDSAGEGITVKHSNSIINVNLLVLMNPHISAIMAAGTYASPYTSIKTESSAATLVLDGDYIFTGSFELESKGTTPSLTIANSTNDPNIIFRNNIIWDQQTGTITWTKGAGTITADGTSNQNWDWEDKAIEDLVINKTGGTLTFADGFTANSVNHQNGTIDPNGQTLATTGDWNMHPTAVMLDPESSTFTIGGNAIWAGVVHSFLSLSGSASWLFNCAGQAIFKYANIKYCNASGSANPVRAIECGDSGNNINVVFQGLRSFVRSFRRGIKKS